MPMPVTRDLPLRFEEVRDPDRFSFGPGGRNCCASLPWVPAVPMQTKPQSLRSRPNPRAVADRRADGVGCRPSRLRGHGLLLSFGHRHIHKRGLPTACSTPSPTHSTCTRLR